MPFAATWIDLEIVTLYEVIQSDRERQIWYDIVHMLNLKRKDTNELLYKREIESQMLKANLRLPRKIKVEG